jgi:hypothetical protein
MLAKNPPQPKNSIRSQNKRFCISSLKSGICQKLAVIQHNQSRSRTGPHVDADGRALAFRIWKTCAENFNAPCETSARKRQMARKQPWAESMLAGSGFRLSKGRLMQCR